MTHNILFLLIAGYLPVSILICSVASVYLPKRFKKVVFLYGLTFGMLAYCYTPTYENDLARYFIELEYCRTIPFSKAINWKDDGLIIRNLLFWLISKTGDDHILPLVSVSTVYYVAAYIVADSSLNCNISIWKLLLFQIMSFPFYSILSNVRNVLSFALITLAVYRDIVQKKRNIITLLLYILPCFIHMAGMVMVLLRLVLIFIKKHPYLGISTTLTIPTSSIILYQKFSDIRLPGNIGKIISRIIWKSYASSVNTSEYAVTRLNSGYFNACRIVMFFICAILLFMLVRMFKYKKENHYEFNIFCGLLIAITMIWIIMGTVKYWIFGFVAILSSVPLLHVFYKNEKNNIIKRLSRIMLVLLMSARFALEIYFTSKRIVISDYLYEFTACSIWKIIGCGLINLLK